MTETEMPKYKCHKEVWALKLSDVEKSEPQMGNEWDGSYFLGVEDPGFGPILVGAEYIRKHKPEAGGYYVQYADGYESFSPAEAFETGYARIT